ncbi:hypothetical protein AB0L40_10920 [Patulibacter sp. NPDC049589]|uniref:hypothetical protein n=1 Tax=Patulibacter sp. NPDC049589 TaxID=3154731 RepID=UPI00341BC95B
MSRESPQGPIDTLAEDRAAGERARPVHRRTAAFPVLTVVLAATVLATAATSAEAAKRWPRNPEFDRPERPLPAKGTYNRKLKLLGGRVLLQRIDNSSNYLKYNGATRGVTGITMFRLVYRTNHAPTPPKLGGDVRATATIGRTIFHDGYQWKTFIGPFTRRATYAPSNCFAKSVFLPTNDPAYQVGKTLPIRITFPRTRQQITLPATIVEGTMAGFGSDLPTDAVLPGNGMPQITDATGIGCPVTKDQGTGSIFDPGAISPASLLPRRYGVPRLPG